MRKFTIFTLILLLMLLAIFMVGCDNETHANETTLDFICDGIIFKSVDYNNGNFLTPTPPQIKGKTFVGWYLDKDLTIPFSKDKIGEISGTSRIKIYSKFASDNNVENKISLSFMMGEKLYSKITFVPNDTFKMPSAPTLANHNFVGWFEDQNYTVEFDYLEALNNGVKESKILYAKMELSSATISLFVDGHLRENLTINYGDEIVLNNPPEKENYEFDAWYIRYTDKKFDATSFMTEANFKDISLEAKFIKLYSRIQIVAQDLHINEIALHRDENLILTKPNDTLTHTFSHWELDGKEFDIEKYNASKSRPDITLYEVWNEKISTITFYNDNVIVGTATISKSLEINYPKAPTKDKYLFANWQVKEGDNFVDFDERIYLHNMNRTDLSLYAKFNEVLVRVNFYSDNILYKTIDVNEDHLLIMPANSQKEDYIFENWIQNNKIFDVKYFNDTLTLNYDSFTEIRVDAMFKMDKKTLQFIDGNKQHALLYYHKDLKFEMPKDPVKDGYIFDGWYLDKSFNHKFDLETYINDKNKTDIALYAKYISVA